MLLWLVWRLALEECACIFLGCHCLLIQYYYSAKKKMSEGRSSASYGSHTVSEYYSVLRNYFFTLGLGVIGLSFDSVLRNSNLRRETSSSSSFRTFYQVPNIRVLWKLKPMDTVFFGVQRQLLICHNIIASTRPYLSSMSLQLFTII